MEITSTNYRTIYTFYGYPYSITCSLPIFITFYCNSSRMSCIHRSTSIKCLSSKIYVYAFMYMRPSLSIVMTYSDFYSFIKVVRWFSSSTIRINKYYWIITTIHIRRNMVIFLTQWVETCESRHKRVVLACTIIVPVQSVGAVEFLAVILVGLQVVSAVVCRGAEHSAKWIVVRYLSHIANFVYNGAIVAIVKPVFHDFISVFFGGKCTKLFLTEISFACILKKQERKNERV